MYNIIGERLKILRKKKNISQQELANSLSVNAMTIVKWEKGTFTPSISHLRLLAKYFNVNIDYLIGEDAFTLYLIQSAEIFAQARKNASDHKNDKFELAQWVVFWNDTIESCANCSYFAPKEWSEINERIGWTKECQNITLKFPDDYNKEIIDYIIKADYNGLIGDFYMLPLAIIDTLPENYEDKPQLYKYLLGYEE